MLGIDVADNAVEGGRLTPALVSPVATAIGKHAGEVGVRGASDDAWPWKDGASVGIGPGGAAVG